MNFFSWSSFEYFYFIFIYQILLFYLLIYLKLFFYNKKLNKNFCIFDLFYYGKNR